VRKGGNPPFLFIKEVLTVSFYDWIHENIFHDEEDDDDVWGDEELFDDDEEYEDADEDEDDGE